MSRTGLTLSWTPGSRVVPLLTSSLPEAVVRLRTRNDGASLSLCRHCRGWLRNSKGDPDPVVVLSFTLDELIARLLPGEDRADRIVENEVAVIGIGEQHRMSRTGPVENDGHSESAFRETGLDEASSFQELDVF